MWPYYQYDLLSKGALFIEFVSFRDTMLLTLVKPTQIIIFNFDTFSALLGRETKKNTETNEIRKLPEDMSYEEHFY